MRTFGDLMHKNPRLTVLEAWAKANAGLEWGAVVHESAARNDTIERWHSVAGLPPIESGSAPRVFNSKNFPKGAPLSKKPIIDARWVHGDGTVIERSNNKPHENSAATRFFVPGARGAIRIIRNKPDLQPGKVIELTGIWVRPGKAKLDWGTLLDFDPEFLVNDPASGKPMVEKLVSKDGNREDGLRIHPRASDQTVIDIRFRLKATIKKDYPSIEDGSHGYFFFSVQQPNFDEHFTALDAAYLK